MIINFISSKIKVCYNISFLNKLFNKFLFCIVLRRFSFYYSNNRIRKQLYKGGVLGQRLYLLETYLKVYTLLSQYFLCFRNLKIQPRVSGILTDEKYNTLEKLAGKIVIKKYKNPIGLSLNLYYLFSQICNLFNNYMFKAFLVERKPFFLKLPLVPFGILGTFGSLGTLVLFAILGTLISLFSLITLNTLGTLIETALPLGISLRLTLEQLLSFFLCDRVILSPWSPWRGLISFSVLVWFKDYLFIYIIFLNYLALSILVILAFFILRFFIILNSVILHFKLFLCVQ